MVANASTCCCSRRVVPAARLRARSIDAFAAAPSPWNKEKSAAPACASANPSSAATAAAKA
jgi:hypothetical protein